jgi:hypothetical protein
MNALGLKSLTEIRKDNNDDTEIVDDAEIIGDNNDEEVVVDTSVVVYEGSDQLPSIPEPDKELLNDIDLAKNNIKKILEVGSDSLAEIASIAKQTESPQAFLAQVQMMKTLLEANRELVNTSKEKKFEKTEQPGNHSTTNVTNNNLVLSTADLLEMLKDGKK